MKGSSKVIMGATLVMVVTLAIVLGLILVLLAELYCSLLLRRRQHKTNSYSNTVADSAAAAKAAPHLPSTQQSQDHPTGPSLSDFLGILRAPRSFLSPPVSSKEEDCSWWGQQRFAEHFVYISNPIYDNEAVGRASGTNTPFQTPDMSPSRMEMGGSSSSSSGDEEVAQPTPSGPSNPITTPPLTPMKKLPAEACSVSLRDTRSLGTSSSYSNSNNGLPSSSSGSPSTSPSW